MTDIEYDFTTCPICGMNYTTQTTCPACQNRQVAQSIVTNHADGWYDEITHTRHESPEKGHRANEVDSSGTDVLGDIPKSLGTTGFKLSVPIEKYGVIIHYVRHYANSKRKKKPYDRYYYSGNWMSSFELWFYASWQATGYPMPTSEHRFHPDREWKFDYAWKDEMIAVELEGGVFSRGRHTRGNGYIEDCMKYNQATALGWQVYRFADKQNEHIDFLKMRFDYPSVFRMVAGGKQ